MVPSPKPQYPDALAHVSVWIFDLDNTLYPASCRLFDQVSRRIGLFIAETFALDPVAAHTLQKHYFHKYGTTLRGLMTEHGVDPHEFLAFVHEIDHSPIPRNPALDHALSRLDGRKIVFTNGSEDHAARVLDRLCVAHHFQAVFDVAAADFIPKPDLACYRALLSRHAIAPHAAAMLDDIPRNLEPAHQLGMTTVLVATDTEYGSTGEEGPHIHHKTDDLAGFLQNIVNARVLAGRGNG